MVGDDVAAILCFCWFSSQRLGQLHSQTVRPNIGQSANESNGPNWPHNQELAGSTCSAQLEAIATLPLRLPHLHHTRNRRGHDNGRHWCRRTLSWRRHNLSCSRHWRRFADLPLQTGEWAPPQKCTRKGAPKLGLQLQKSPFKIVHNLVWKGKAPIPDLQFKTNGIQRHSQYPRYVRS